MAFDEGNLEANAAAAARGEYGTMKIGEPDTPFAEAVDPEAEVAAAEAEAEAEVGRGGVVPMALEDPEGLPGAPGAGPGGADGNTEMRTPGGGGEGAREAVMTEEEEAAIKRQLFEAKRKAHYNMGGALRRA